MAAAREPARLDPLASESRAESFEASGRHVERLGIARREQREHFGAGDVEGERGREEGQQALLLQMLVLKLACQRQ